MSSPTSGEKSFPPSRAAYQDSNVESIHSNSAPVLRGGDVVDHGSKPLAIIALVASCLSLGAVGMYVVLAAQIIDSKIQAGAAQSEAVANQARVDARVSLDEVQRIRSRLEAKGIYSTDH